MAKKTKTAQPQHLDDELAQAFDSVDAAMTNLVDGRSALWALSKARERRAQPNMVDPQSVYNLGTELHAAFLLLAAIMGQAKLLEEALKHPDHPGEALRALRTMG